jgi:hypothetical protein
MPAFLFQTNAPVWPDAQPWDALTFAAAAILVVWLNRKAMFRREGAAVEVAGPKPMRHRGRRPRRIPERAVRR